jgi:hypothetical protein
VTEGGCAGERSSRPEEDKDTGMAERSRRIVPVSTYSRRQWVWSCVVAYPMLIASWLVLDTRTVQNVLAQSWSRTVAAFRSVESITSGFDGTVNAMTPQIGKRGSIVLAASLFMIRPPLSARFLLRFAAAVAIL